MTIVWILAIAILALSLLTVLAFRWAKIFPPLLFVLRGNQQGFSFKEIALLWGIARRVDIKNSHALFWSTPVFDQYIRAFISEGRTTGTLEDRRSSHFLNKMFRMRGNLTSRGMRRRIWATRELAIGDILTLKHRGMSARVRIVQARRNSLHTTPMAGQQSQNWLLSGTEKTGGGELVVLFARKDDAEYSFKSKILKTDHQDDRTNVFLEHGKKITRVQRRRHPRHTLDVAGLVKKIDPSGDVDERYEPIGSFRCRVREISESGAMLVIGGSARTGMALKIQFMAGDAPIVMCAKVIRFSYNSERNYTILHLKTDKPSTVMSNRINAIVYGFQTVTEQKTTPPRT